MAGSRNLMPPEKKLPTFPETPEQQPCWGYHSESDTEIKQFREEIMESLEKAYHQGTLNLPLIDVFKEGDAFNFDFLNYTFSAKEKTEKFKFERKASEYPPPKYLPPPPKKGFSFAHITEKISDVFLNTKKKPQQSPTPAPVPHSLKDSTENHKIGRPSLDIVAKVKTEDDYLEKIIKTHPKPPAPFDFTILPLPLKRFEGGQSQLIYDQLHAFFLSPASLTENDKDNLITVIKEKKNDELLQILKENVENIDSMFDRSGTTPVAQFIVSTYTHGLPLFKGNNVVQNHTIHAMKIIFDRISLLPLSTRKSMLKRIAEAYTACQMEQGRVIDSIYGSITGRDKNLKAQILTLVDLQKETVLNQLINHYNPEAWKTTDDNPMGQIPHIQSSYCIALSPKLGLRGIKAALLDKDSFQVHITNTEILTEAFKRMFSIQDLINTIITDVNQQDEGADRLIDIDCLSRWAGDVSVNNGFDSYSIFYDEFRAEEWPKDLGVPKPENQFKPFLNQKTTVQMLNHLIIK